MKEQLTESQRFWSKVKIGAPHECWPWIWTRASLSGYFCVSSGNVERCVTGKKYLMEAMHGRYLRDDEYVFQTCHTQECLNPNHIQVGDHLAEAFNRFEANILRIPFCKCWLWTASTFRDGYGQFQYRDKMWKAHRWAYWYFVGDIPDGLCVLHRCDTPLCVRPECLFLGTQQDNVKDRVEKRRGCDGVDHWCAKLTATDVLAIRNRPTEDSLALAQEYGIERSTIYNIRRNKTWNGLCV